MQDCQQYKNIFWNICNFFFFYRRNKFMEKKNVYIHTSITYTIYLQLTPFIFFKLMFLPPFSIVQTKIYASQKTLAEFYNSYIYMHKKL